MTRAPAALAIWMAITPMPLVAPWINKVSPDFRPPPSKTLVKTVKTVSGRAAAWTKSRASGTGRACRASTTA
ncbi:hypothetical protein D3C86_1697330 [compost metagenome]